MSPSKKFNPNLVPPLDLTAENMYNGLELSPTDDNHTMSWSTDETTLEQSLRGMSESGPAGLTDKEITHLAQQLTRESTQFSALDDLENPFVEKNEFSSLNPHSSEFKARNWMKNLLALTSRDPERYPERAAGISFRDLSVHGFGSPTDYQKDVLNSVLQIGHLFRLATGTGRQKIQILRNFDGLVKSGEMLVVLGRPGRYAHTISQIDIIVIEDMLMNSSIVVAQPC